MKIKRRLLIPNVLLAILSVFTIGALVKIKGQIENSQTKQEKTARINHMLLDYSLSIEEFVSKNHTNTKTIEKRSKQISEYVRSVGAEKDMGKILKDVRADISEIKEINGVLSQIESDFFHLTKTSIDQSAKYIRNVSERLADGNKRHSVGTLERAVIAGAYQNSAAGYKLRELFYEMKYNLSQSQEMTDYLNLLLSNVKKDVRNLSGTPFVSLARTALEANKKIQTKINRYISEGSRKKEIIKEMNTSLNSFHDRTSEFTADRTDKIFAGIVSSYVVINVVILFISMLILMINMMTSKIINRPLDRLTKMFQEIAEGQGDLTKRIRLKSTNEIGIAAGWFDKFIERLNSIILSSQLAFGSLSEANADLKKQFSQSADLVKSIDDQAANIENQLSVQGRKNKETKDVINDQKKQADTLIEHISDVKNQSDLLKNIADEQSSAITEMSATIEQQTSNISSISKNTGRTNEKITAVANYTEKNKESMAQTSQDIKKMVEKIDSINDFADLISEIASQTNLLAMNAAIEAAHAGESGKGFAVVAEEIRKLADRSNVETEKVKKLLEDFVGYTERVDTSFRDTSENFNTMSQNITEATNMTSEITSAIEEQTSGNREMLKAVENIQNITGRLDESKNNLSQSSSDMAGSAEKFSEIIKKVMNAFDELKAISDEMNTSVGSVLSGTGDISSGIEENNRTIENMQNEIGKLSAVLEQFKTEDTETKQLSL